MNDELMEWVEVNGIKYKVQQEVAHELERVRKDCEAWMRLCDEIDAARNALYAEVQKYLGAA